ncbi:class I SAM-dependent methyltransferase [Phormidium sp. FACHB-592]|uniref:TylF/MycF family methyltransferase n=1 Tax=Stenomitos frigidus AS-A4 TaxID=2933935 RepID=A0ABV0KGX5_9CYAN|nr:TylF/MycF/NovP-related O-methyltransferase [Phormidium sp. FACHB-592]MBD2078131.1 class I SAM-dependent methyltransferase [Phormidium sp. FACHB-592]
MLRDYLPKFLRKVLQADSGSASVEAPAILTTVEQTEAEPFTQLMPTTESTETEQIIQKIRPYSMVPDSGVEFLIKAVQSIYEQQIEGDFVECGVWRGGCAAAMKLAERSLQPHSQRLLHLFDSYEGLPPVQPIDGPMAAGWQQAVDSPWYFDNCTASLEDVQRNFSQLGLLDSEVHFYKGWFETTVPEFVKGKSERKIAILRLDGDWYESTKVCLENLYPLVSEKGIIIIDDYYAWDGCAVAVHEYLGSNGLNHRIRSIPDFSSAYIIKQAHRDA